MFEKRWAAVSPQSFVSDGTQQGRITVIDSSLFKVKQDVNITANSLPPLNLEIKSIPDGTTILVGPRNSTLTTYSDVSAYTVAGSAAIYANEQKRSSVPQEEVIRAVYEEEPIVATRVIPVDELGAIRNDDNPVPIISGTDWDEADITRDGDDDIVKVEFSKIGVFVKDIELEYNGEKSVIKITKSKA